MKRSVTVLSLALSIILTVTMIAGCSSSHKTDMIYTSSPALNTSNSRASGGAAAPSSSPPGGAPYFADSEGAWRYAPVEDAEEYAYEPESTFKDVKTSPLSTFSADVDTASYSNMRRCINMGIAPVGVRIEELVNYFDYSYPAPDPGDEYPFSITTEVSVCPWAPEHLLTMIGIQGARLNNTESIANNIVFLIDVSGSMNSANKLPLVIDSMKLLLGQLGEKDRISIVTYAGSERIVADSVPGSETRKLTRLIDGLSAGGSTAGAQGIKTAYSLAAKNFIDGGNNRVILATDGDFNVGESSVAALTKLIETEREKGVFISVLGYGMGNLKDDMMEAIAANGNGNYAYIDTLQEASKVLVDEFDSTMFTIARDVKLQIEFNPVTVSSYRLIGYDTRRLENEDFNNDLKDAGDIGSGHNVTAFYEIVPAGTEESDDDADGVLIDPLRYSSISTTGSNEFMNVKIRYKEPDRQESMLVEQVVGPEALKKRVSDNFVFASAVVEFGLIVTDSGYCEGSSVRSVLSRAKDALGDDAYGLRAEFLELVRKYEKIIG